MTVGLAFKLERAAGGYWEYDRSAKVWRDLNSERLPRGGHRRYAVRDGRRFVLYDALRPDQPPQVVR